MKSAARILCSASIILSLAAGCSKPQPSPAEFARATAPRAWSFPSDHGSHPAFRTEWWYLTGHLQDEEGRAMGYQLTFFRSAKPIPPDQSPTGRPLLAQVVNFHGAWSDASSQLFLYDEARGIDLRRTGDADEGRLRVQVLPHELADRGDGSWRASFHVQGVQFDLEFRPERAPVLHGAQPGLTAKGHEPGEASHYYSITRLRTSGTVRDPGGARARRVEGQSWFDHEFGTQQMGAEVAGWNWFSITLSDGSDLMLYLLRRADGQYDSHSAGTVVSPDGHAEHLTQDQFSVEATATWTSPHTGATYPSAWRIRVPGRALELEGAPLLPDQELQSPQTVQVTYWEGATLFRGTQGGQPVEGRGYVELTGYAKALTRIF